MLDLVPFKDIFMLFCNGEANPDVIVALLFVLIGGVKSNKI